MTKVISITQQHEFQTTTPSTEEFLERHSSITIEMPKPTDTMLNPSPCKSIDENSSACEEGEIFIPEENNEELMSSISESIEPSGNKIKYRVSRQINKQVMLSSLEEFDPNKSAAWLKNQFNSKIKSNPKIKEALKYAQIDFFRPYFYVEPKQLQHRLIDAYKPSLPLLQQEARLLFYGTTNGAMVSPKKISPELYGPLMVILTLAAIIPFDMHHASAITNPGSLRETTLISSALITTFSYWSFATAATFWVVQHTKTFVNIVQVASVLGYSMTSVCIVIGLGGITERAGGNEEDVGNLAFYLLWASIGGVANLRLALILVGRTPMDYSNRLKRLSVGILPFFLNMLFMLYLHFSYHYIVEAVIDKIPDG